MEIREFWHTKLFQYIYFFRDFTGGTLGLAWVASASGASGGICETYKRYTENINGVHHTAKRSLNTGIITFVNYNSPVPPKGKEFKYETKSYIINNCIFRQNSNLRKNFHIHWDDFLRSMGKNWSKSNIHILKVFGKSLGGLWDLHIKSTFFFQFSLPIDFGSWNRA